MTSAEKKRFNLLVKENEDLKRQLASCENSKESYWKNYQETKREIDSIHAALDVLPGIPGKKVKISEYNDVELTINARLFAWISSVAFGQKSKPESAE